MRDPGCDLHARGAGQEILDERPRRLVRIGVEDASKGGAARRVAHDRGERSPVGRGRVGAAHGYVEAEHVGVRSCDGGGERVVVHTGDGQPGPRQLDEVAADPAAQVENGPAQRGEPVRPVAGDAGPGRLFEPVDGEVHAFCVNWIELLPGAPPQVRLGECRGNEIRGVVAPQPPADGKDVVLGVRFDRRGKQLLPVRRAQRLERLDVHGVSLTCRDHESKPCRTAARCSARPSGPARYSNWPNHRSS